MTLNLANHRIAVAGGAGFLGQAVVQRMQQPGHAPPSAIAIPRSTEYDLRTEEGVERFYNDFQPEVVIHLAGKVGGIGGNRANPGQFFYDNAVMGIQLIEYGLRLGLKKFVCIGTVCAYPKVTTVPFLAEHFWKGFPEETNAPYGIAKRMLLAQCHAYRQQYGLNAIFLIPVNLYGPGDKFSLANSHVIPALVRKMVEAKFAGESQVELWGDGSPTREFLYVHDAADGIVRGTTEYDGADPINLGSGREISIRDLADKIKSLTGFEGRIVWNSSWPGGQPRRCLDTCRAKSLFHFEAQTSFDEGLKTTCHWYLQNRRSILQDDRNYSPP